MNCPTCQAEVYTPDGHATICPNGCGWVEEGPKGPSSPPPEDEKVMLWKEPGTWDVQTWADGSSGDRELELKVAQTMWIAFRLWQARQKKYGRGNIARTGALGCYIRLEDKMARLRGTYVHNKGEMPDESISDTWLDLMNYATMGYMCHHNTWPGLDQADWYGETNKVR